MATFYQTFSTAASPPKLYTSFVAKGKKVALSKFKSLMHQSAFLHLWFILSIIVEAVISTTVFSMDPFSFATSASFALLFLSIASYVLVAFYQKNRKLDAIDSISKEFRHHVIANLSKNIEDNEKLHLAIAECTRDLAEALHTQELFYLTVYPFKFSKKHIISHLLYFHFNDIVYFQEKLLEISLQEHATILEDCACSLDFHSSLSKTYATHATIYKKPDGKHLEKAFAYSTFTKKAEFGASLEKYYTLAIEELKIISELCNDEYWIHSDLASLYAFFNDSEKEMEQYEILMSKISDDKEIMYKLGVLYFKHQQSSKGLKIYNDLRKLDALYAKNLLSHYHFS